jgi:hypothetical protein
MHKQNLTKISLLIMIGLALNYSQATAQAKINVEHVGQTVEAPFKDIDWEVFDTASTISRIGIKVKDIQGLWVAYKGAYRFDGNVNGMELSEPVIFEVKDSGYRRNVNKDFKKFILSGNLIIRTEELKIDTGIINKITPTELTISWKNKSNYTRYYYKK